MSDFSEAAEHVRLKLWVAIEHDKHPRLYANDIAVLLQALDERKQMREHLRALAAFALPEGE